MDKLFNTEFLEPAMPLNTELWELSLDQSLLIVFIQFMLV
jgi:hypothetical protein